MGACVCAHTFLNIKAYIEVFWFGQHKEFADPLYKIRHNIRNKDFISAFPKAGNTLKHLSSWKIAGALHKNNGVALSRMVTFLSPFLVVLLLESVDLISGRDGKSVALSSKNAELGRGYVGSTSNFGPRLYLG